MKIGLASGSGVPSRSTSYSDAGSWMVETEPEWGTVLVSSVVSAPCHCQGVAEEQMERGWEEIRGHWSDKSRHSSQEDWGGVDCDDRVEPDRP